MPGQQIVCEPCSEIHGNDYDCQRTMIPGNPGQSACPCHICFDTIGKNDMYYWMNDEFVEKGKEVLNAE